MRGGDDKVPTRTFQLLWELGPALVVGAVVVVLAVVALLGISNFRQQPNAIMANMVPEEHLKSERESQRNNQIVLQRNQELRKGSPKIRKRVSIVAGCRRKRSLSQRKPFIV